MAGILHKEDAEKKEAYKKLIAVRAYFEEKGAALEEGPGVAFGSDFLVYTRSQKHKSLYFFVQVIKPKNSAGWKYQCKYQGDDVNASYLPEIQKHFNDATFSPGRGKNPNRKIVFPVRDATNAAFEDFKIEAFNRFDLTKDIMGF